MAKVWASFKVKDYFTTKYKTKVFTIPELPKSNFHTHYQPIDINALGGMVEDLINREYPTTYNTLLRFAIKEN